LKFDVLQIPYDQFVLNFGTKAVIDYAHKYGLAVQYWTINDPVKIAELCANGADCIMTDNPEAGYNIINKK
ncbi:MAG: glycerophosphodiester phosphodiesterase family protein, partial [Clostridia bacterium]